MSGFDDDGEWSRYAAYRHGEASMPLAIEAWPWWQGLAEGQMQGRSRRPTPFSKCFVLPDGAKAPIQAIEHCSW